MRTKYLWLSLSLAAAGGAAVLLLAKKNRSASAGNKAEPAPTAAKGKAPAGSGLTKEASYSFISGFKDAATVELKFPYDAERFSFSVLEDEFLTESGDSHVGVLYGEAFSAQFEYGTYYSGEDFARLRQELTAKHRDLTDAVYDGLHGVKFRDGDNYCLAFPIPDDVHSYLLVTLVKAPDNDDELEALPDYPDLHSMLGSLVFSRG